MMRDPLIEAAARATHEANRAWCIHNNDHSQLPWDTAPEWQRESARKGVIGVIRDGNGPRESHASWLAEKEATGWRYGPVKDVDKKEHPCMVPYDELPPEQRAKDSIFVNVVCAFREAFNALPLRVFCDDTSWVAARTPYDALTALCEYTGGARLRLRRARRGLQAARPGQDVDDRRGAARPRAQREGVEDMRRVGSRRAALPGRRELLTVGAPRLRSPERS